MKWSRYRPGVAQIVGRGIALLFHDSGTRRWWLVSSTPRPHSTAGKDPVPIVQEAGWAPGPVWAGGKSRPYRDSIPDLPARSSVAIPTELPGPQIYTYTYKCTCTCKYIVCVCVCVCVCTSWNEYVNYAGRIYDAYQASRRNVQGTISNVNHDCHGVSDRCIAMIAHIHVQPSCGCHRY